MRRLHTLLLTATRVATVVLFLIPLIWLAGAALHPPGTPLPTSLRLLPELPAPANFARAAALVPLWRFGLNSLLVCALAVPLTLLSASWAGLGMALLRPDRQRQLILLSLGLLLVPPIALWVPRFLVYRQLGWLDSPLALIAPALMGSSPLFVLLYYRAFHRLPAELFDAARVDGAGILRLWAQVALPLAQPTSIAVALLSFALYWGDLLSPLLYLRTERFATLPVALQLLAELGRSDWPIMAAGALLASLPPLLLFGLVYRAIRD